MSVDKTNLLTADEILHRQCNSKTIQDGRPWSRLFSPTDRDAGLLSADRESLRSAKEAYEAYLAAKGAGSSAGAWGVSVNEFLDLDLFCYADEIAGNDAHALIDFSSLTKDESLEKAKLARDKALNRNRLYPSVIEETAPPAPAPAPGD